MKKALLLLVFLFSLGQSFAQVIYNKDNYFLTRVAEGSTDWSISFELIIISFCIGAFLLLEVLVYEDRKFYFGKEPSEKISIYHFIPSFVLILTAVIYSNHVMTSFNLEMIIVAGIALIMIALSINKYHVWNLSRYLIVQLVNIIIAASIVLCITQSPLAMVIIMIPPMFIVALILHATDW